MYKKKQLQFKEVQNFPHLHSKRVYTLKQWQYLLDSVLFGHT